MSKFTLSDAEQKALNAFKEKHSTCNKGITIIYSTINPVQIRCDGCQTVRKLE